MGGVGGDRRNILNECLVCGFQQYLNSSFRQALVSVSVYVSTGANLKWDKFYICTSDVCDSLRVFFGFSCVGVQNISIKCYS